MTQGGGPFVGLLVRPSARLYIAELSLFELCNFSFSVLQLKKKKFDLGPRNFAHVLLMTQIGTLFVNLSVDKNLYGDILRQFFWY